MRKQTVDQTSPFDQKFNGIKRSFVLAFWSDCLYEPGLSNCRSVSENLSLRRTMYKCSIGSANSVLPFEATERATAYKHAPSYSGPGVTRTRHLVKTILHNDSRATSRQTKKSVTASLVAAGVYADTIPLHLKETHTESRLNGTFFPLM
jgi:hypothetical protein